MNIDAPMSTLGLGRDAIAYMAMQAPVTDNPEDYGFDPVVSRAVYEAKMADDGVLRLPVLRYDHGDLVALVEDALVNAERHAEDRETFNASERATARRAQHALERFLA